MTKNPEVEPVDTPSTTTDDAAARGREVRKASAAGSTDGAGGAGRTGAEGFARGGPAGPHGAEGAQVLSEAAASAVRAERAAGATAPAEAARAEGAVETVDAVEPTEAARAEGAVEAARAEGAVEAVDAIVVGGGIGGLTAARTLARRGLRVVVLEADDLPGGPVRGGHFEALPQVPVDVGVESYAARGTAVTTLAEDLGLTVVTPSAAQAWGYAAGKTFPLPRAGMLGIPSVPWAADVRRAIGWPGVLRASLDWIMPGRFADTTSLGSLVRSRLGRRVADRLVTLVAAGVHSATLDTLDVDAVAPGLLDAFRREGSLAKAVGSLRRGAPAGAMVRGVDGGIHAIVEALVGELNAEADRWAERDDLLGSAGVRTGERVIAIAHDGGDGAAAVDRADGPGRGAAADGPDRGANAERADESDHGADAGRADRSSCGATADRSAGSDRAGADRAGASSDRVVETESSAVALDSSATARVDGGDREAPGRWSVTTASGARLTAPRVVLATPAVADLVADAVGATAPTPTPGAPIALVALLLDAPELDAAPRGTGMLIAPDADAGRRSDRPGDRQGGGTGGTTGGGTGVGPGGTTGGGTSGATGGGTSGATGGGPGGGTSGATGGGTGVGAKAFTHATAKWPWLADRVRAAAGEGVHIVRLSYGRLGDGGATPDVERATHDASVLLGVDLNGRVRDHLVQRWDGSLPPPTPAYRAALGGFTTAVDGTDGLAVVGGWIAGTGLAAIITHAQETAADL